MKVSGISTGFPVLSQSSGQVAHVLRTRSPLSTGASSGFTFDLHVLSAPPAFVLSQDQTLREVFFRRTEYMAGETFTLSLVLKGRGKSHDEVCLSRPAEANRSSSRRL